MPITATTPTMGGLSGPSSYMPALNLPGIGANQVNPGTLQTNPSQVYSLLSNLPTSLTSTIGPLLQQVFGAQANLMQPLFAQQGQQGAALAQSGAMQRGLSGSSIEAQGMQQAYTGANNAYAQYLAGQLNNLVPQYTGAAQYDIGNMQQYYGNLAQAVGQQLASQIQQQQFQQQLQAGLEQAQRLASAQQMAGLFGGVGGLMGGLFQGAGAAGGFGQLFGAGAGAGAIGPEAVAGPALFVA